MDGQFPNKKKIRSSLDKWFKSVNSSVDSWEANNLHIDEITTFENILRLDWLLKSIQVFELLINEVELDKNFLVIPFLHIELSYVNSLKIPKKLTYGWINKNIDILTPPSYNFTSIEYYNNFYKTELIKCEVDKSLLCLPTTKISFNYFFRTFYQESEKKYSREIYIFK